jgi:hypothetical protein
MLLFFSESNNNKDNGIIVIANAITLDEINREKTKTIDRVKSRSKGTATRSTLY